MNLSKSRYCSGVQCPKMLWLKLYKPELFDNAVMNEAVLETGSEVGDLAMGLFGDFVEVTSYDGDRLDLKKMIERTDEEIAKGTLNIAEASFTYKGMYCAVDILRNLGDKHVEIYEVKSSTSVHEIYLYDTAYQYYLLKKLGYSVDRVCVVHINSSYVRHGDIDLSEFFTIEDVSVIARSKESDTEERIAFLEEYLKNDEEPLMDIGLHCHDPYQCGFYKYCSRHLIKPNVFDIASLQKRTAYSLYERGVVSFEEIYKDHSLKENYLLQVESELFDAKPYINKEFISEFMSKLTYPLYFLDFETCQFAIPEYDDSKPFAQIPFQYSLHYMEKEGGELKHKEFLAYPDTDPRRALAESLCRDIPENVCVTAYNMSFEKTRIKELAELYPDLSDHLLNIRDHIYDLMIPFQKKMYYSKAMQGSYSIKYVLPALYPNDPELDYHNLEGVHNGAEASNTFRAMKTMDKETLEIYRKHLLKYCGLDTLAMVKVFEKLKEAANDQD